MTEPALRTAITAPRLVARERELATLREALDQPAALVLIEGEAGVGKSRLVRELAAPGVAVGVCPPYREALTLSPIIDAVRRVASGLGQRRLSPLAGALRPLLPEWAAALPPSPEPLADPPAARHRLYRALAELVGSLGIGLLVVEDTHWADDATLEFLLFLAANPEAPSLVVTYRAEDTPTGSLLRRLSGQVPAGRVATRIELAPLDLAGTAGLVASMLGDQPVDPQLTGLLHQQTDGLPLAVEESVRLLWARTDLVRRDGTWRRLGRDQLPVPPTVRDAVLERMGRLGPAARRLLIAAAVLAEPADEAVLRRVAGLPADQTRAGLREALAAGLLGDEGTHRVGFRHVLAARAVYQATPGPERRRRHLAAGEALALAHPPPLVQLARQYREAGRTVRWRQYAERAAELATAAGDHTTAARMLNEVLTGSRPPPAIRARLARELATAAVLRWEVVDELHREAVVTLRAVLAAPDLPPRAQAGIRSPLGRLLMQVEDWEAGRREMERAVAHLGHDPAEAARTMIYLGMPLGPWPAAVHLEWLARAATVEARVRSPLDRLALASDRAAALLLLGEEAGWAAAELPATGASLDERYQLARGLFNTGSAAIMWGRYGSARAWLARAEELADRNRLARVHGRILASLAQLDWLEGSWAGLADRLPELEARPHLTLTSRRRAVQLLAHLRAAGGAHHEAEQVFRRTLQDARRLGLADEILEPAAALGRLWLAEGRTEDALRVTDEAMRVVTGKGVWVWAGDIAPVRLDALFAAGRVEESRQLVAAFTRGLRGRGAPAPLAALATCRAILRERTGDPLPAARGYARAARAWDQLPRPYDALRCRERQAGCLLAAGQPADGLALLATVLTGFTALGARGDADRVAQHLRAGGVDVRRPWRGGRRGYGDQLSPREREVVQLVVAGRTNREIATLLSRSPHTVSAQLRSAMQKLGVSSRTALAVSVLEEERARGGEK